MMETKDVHDKVDEQLQELADIKDQPHERPASFPFRLFAIYLLIAGALGLAVLLLLGLL